MPPKYIILIYMICSIMNSVHIYQICNVYFRYDVTTKVRIAVPEELEFPSVTLCMDIVSTLKWTQMTSELRRYLLTRPLFPEPIIETMVSNGSFVEEALLKLSFFDKYHIFEAVYTNLAQRKTIPEILNLTKPIEDLYRLFLINGLFKKPDGSIQSYEMYTEDMSDFQFTIDKTFLYSGLKCFTLSLRPELYSTINLNDLWNMESGSKVLLAWQSVSGFRTRVFLHRKRYLVSLKDPIVFVEQGHMLLSSFEVLEAILLKYPYNTNCRDYSVIGLSSRKECREKCFKSKTVARFGYVSLKSHAFVSDELYTRPDTHYTSDIRRECKLDCLQKECHSFTYTFEKLKEENLVKFIGRMCLKSNGSTCSEEDMDLRKHSELYLMSPDKPFTRTEIQSAMSLVSFVTAVMSTFGFWMGLSVSGAAFFVKQTWTQAMNLGSKIGSRQTLATQRSVNQRIINTNEAWRKAWNLSNKMGSRQRLEVGRLIDQRLNNSLRQLIPQIIVNLQKRLNRDRRTHPE